jgi:hypothetical protein
MAGLLDSDLGKQIISGVAGSSGAPENKTADLLGMALPVLMGAMQKNASTPYGSAGLFGAVMGKHNGVILDNLGSFFQGGVDESVVNDGAGILSHVLGDKQGGIENALSQKSGLDINTVAQILKVAAPILMGVIGKQARQSGVQDAGGLGNILGGLSGGGAGSKQQSLIESLLDANGNGTIIDDVTRMLLGGGNQKKGGLGGLLSGLFGKR